MEVTTQPATERTALAPVPGNVPNPENRWRGGSQMSWTNPAYTEMVGLFTSTLDREQRADQLAQMARTFSDDVAVISLNFPPLVWAAVSALTGPKAGLPETNFFWNVHEWELR
jgi:ABC-type transport system substrate-binding protein